MKLPVVIRSLQEVAEMYPDFNNLIDVLSTWFKIHPDYKEYFKEIIKKATEIEGQISWKQLDSDAYYENNRQYLTKIIANKSKEVGIPMTILKTVIPAVIEYCPQKEQQPSKEPQQPQQVARDNKRTTTKEKSGIDATTNQNEKNTTYFELTQEQKDTAAAIKAKAEREAKEKFNTEEKDLARIEQTVQKTNDPDELKEILKKVYPYRKDHQLAAEAIISAIKRKLSRTKPIIASTDRTLNIRVRILKDLSSGTLDVKKAIGDIEQVAKEACEKMPNKSKIPGVRITPIAYKSQILMNIIMDIKNEAMQYPIVEGREDDAIRQLQQLGATSQQATGAIVENLINTQNYQRARSVVEQYANSNQSNPTTQTIIENWNRMIRRRKQEQCKEQGGELNKSNDCIVK